MEKLKQFFSSKINWTAIILILVTLQDHIMQMDFTGMGAKEWVTFTLGILIIIFRTYFTTTAVKMVALFLFTSLAFSSCSINKQLENTMNYFQKHGSATYKKEPNGAITTNVTYKGFYDPTKVKQTFSKFIATYNATEPSINIVATTADTTLKLSVPAFKK